MKSPITETQNAECTECYTDFGYLLSPKKACVKCEEQFCVNCGFVS